MGVQLSREYCTLFHTKSNEIITKKCQRHKKGSQTIHTNIEIKIISQTIHKNIEIKIISQNLKVLIHKIVPK